MNYLSVCSGIEAATVAWHPLGWKPWAFAEIEKFPSAVLAHHYPHVPNLGDMTKFKDWPDAAPDVLVGGTPCQSFSVAGLRKGMADPRGNLALIYLGIADRYRPEWLLWENVPGVLSSNGGRDFGSILGGMAELGYGFAYRVLDAQYVRVDGFGRAVPQQRRRVFVVGNLGSWRRAAAVLFERESLSWDTAPRREAGQDVAGTVGAGLARCSADDADRAGLIVAGGGIPDRALCLNAGGMGRIDAETETLIPMLMPRGGSFDDDVAHALRAEGFDASEDGTGRGTPLVIAHAVAQTLTRGAESSGKGGYAGRRQEDNANIVAFFENTSAAWAAVRRLMPVECERLQGFPEIRKSVIIEVCEGEKSEHAKYADRVSILRNHEASAPVVAHALIDLERQHLQLLSLGKSVWSASIAEKPNSSPLSMQLDGFARLVAAMTSTLVSATPHGKAESLANISNSFPQWNGSAFARVSGREIDELAADAVPFTTAMDHCMKSITSAAGQNSQNYGQILQTSSCCAALAIRQFIPEPIRRASSYAVVVETVGGYTDVPWRKKNWTPDGPRYKALGNSMAVNVMRWIGMRIQHVSDLAAQEAIGATS